LGRYGRTFFTSTGGLSAGGLSAGTVAWRAVIIATALCLLSGCGLIGRSKSTQGQAEPESMTVTSPMIENGSMAMRYTCHGAGETPPIFWSGIPPGTRSLALVVDDAATPITPRLYWIVFDISPATTDIQAGSLPTGAREARNSTGRVGYDPPCPAGSLHRYRFTVYALGTMPHQPTGATLRDAWSAIARHAIARGRLTVTALP
jgi:Raf kinase inhibitor-like YbhB/YbcL family protein